MPHADTHAVVLPHTLAFILPAVLEAQARALGAPTSLEALGMPAEGTAEVVRQVLATPYASPRPLAGEAVAALLARALAGERPS